jgi:urease accessory protein UreE
MIGLAALVGHAVGNRHRPVAVDHGTISFPLQVKSEVDVFRQLLPAGVKMRVEEKVFLPTGEVHIHE